MKTAHTLLSLLALLSIGTTSAADVQTTSDHHAEHLAHAKQRLAEHFSTADTDHDGKLTLAEAQAGLPHLAKFFDKIDVKKQGYLTQDDLKAWMARRHEARHADKAPQ